MATKVKFPFGHIIENTAELRVIETAICNTLNNNPKYDGEVFYDITITGYRAL